MRRLSSGLVLGYHGCDADVAERLLSGADFKASKNDYDWLGEGIYFWENNPQRGLEFAKESARRKNSRIIKPSVIGAVLDMGLCLDLTTKSSLDILKICHEALVTEFNKAENELPHNSENGLLRPLDCAVITKAHELLAASNLIVDSVRGVFVEGAPLYESSGFQAKTHIQIAVRNPSCIKGVFRVAAFDLEELAT